MTFWPETLHTAAAVLSFALALFALLRICRPGRTTRERLALAVVAAYAAEAAYRQFDYIHLDITAHTVFAFLAALLGLFYMWWVTYRGDT